MEQVSIEEYIRPRWKKAILEDLMKNMLNGLYKKEEFYGNGTQIIKMGELFATDFVLNQKNMDRLELTDKELEKHGLKEGDLLFARRSYVREGSGKCSIVENLEEPLVPESSIIRARPDKSKVNPKFIYYFFKSKLGRDAIRRIIRQTAVSGIAQSDLREIEIPKPARKEQDKIVSYLIPIDRKMEINNKINQLLEEIAQTIFKSWFIDFEPCGEKDLEYNRKLDEKIPKKWNVRPLSEVADFLNGLAWQNYRAEEDEDSLPVIKIRELREDVSEKSDRVHREVPEKYIVRDGDVIFSWSASLLIRLWTGSEGFLNQHLFKVTSEDFPKWFYYFWTSHHLRKFRHIAAGKATTMGHIKRKDLEEALVLVPPGDILEEMTEVMSPLLTMRIFKGIESRKLKSLRDTLLPKLMSGEIRVGDHVSQ